MSGSSSLPISGVGHLRDPPTAKVGGRRCLRWQKLAVGKKREPVRSSSFPIWFLFFLLMIVFWGGAIKTWETRFSFFYFEWGLFQKQSSVFRNLRSFFWKFLIRNSASALCIFFLFFGPSGGVGGEFCSFHSFHSLPESLEKISLLIALPPL